MTNLRDRNDKKEAGYDPEDHEADHPTGVKS